MDPYRVAQNSRILLRARWSMIVANHFVIALKVFDRRGFADGSEHLKANRIDRAPFRRRVEQVSTIIEHNARIAEAEKAIAAKRSPTMANVESVANEAASAIVEKLTGVTPATNDVADAVTKALKR
jgi:hypothetical protein